MSLKKYKYFIWNRILKIINQIFVKNNDLLTDIFVLNEMNQLDKVFWLLHFNLTVCIPGINFHMENDIQS